MNYKFLSLYLSSTYAASSIFEAIDNPNWVKITKAIVVVLIYLLMIVDGIFEKEN